MAVTSKIGLIKAQNAKRTILRINRSSEVKFCIFLVVMDCVSGGRNKDWTVEISGQISALSG